MFYIKLKCERLNSAETSDTKKKRFELKTDAENKWQHNCPYQMFQDIRPLPHFREVYKMLQ
jgi:hypothetical protein